MVNKFIAAVILAFVLCPLVSAQSGQGYLFFAPGQIRTPGSSDFGIHFGGGGKYVAKNGLGVGAEIGVAGPTKDFSDNDAGVFSANGYYVFKPGSKVEPFVTGGYSRFFGHDAPGNWGNFGGGLTYWAGDKVGLLLEFRDHVNRTEGSTIQFWAIRLGVAFRSKP